MLYTHLFLMSTVCTTVPGKSCNVIPVSRVAEILDGKGGGKKGRFQGKANKLSRRAEAEKLLWDYISAHKDTEQ